MNREDLLRDVLSIHNPNILLELATGTGKSRLAIEKLKQLTSNKGKLLIVVNRLVHKQTWMDEIDKWWKDCKMDITLTTYVSFPKYAGYYDAAIFDEVQHLSERCQSYIPTFQIKHSILCSATVPKDIRNAVKALFPDLYVYHKSLRNTIEEGILPDPEVYIMPITLDNKCVTETYNHKFKGVIRCTQLAKYNLLSKDCEYWKNRYMFSPSIAVKNKWLFACNTRLKWLGSIKTPLVKLLQYIIGDCRSLTFCTDIAQTKELGENCINSKNKASSDILNLFNSGKINHITACNMLNEGVNLINCQVGIYANLNASRVITKQRLGRLLRHPHPIIIIPYFKNTRDEELIIKMQEDYDPQKVHIINAIEEIQL